MVVSFHQARKDGGKEKNIRCTASELLNTPDSADLRGLSMI